MRVGDFSVEVIGAESDSTQELSSGHVLARPGHVYKLRLRNHGPLRAVADISIDGHGVTGGGLVINAWTTVDLERPIHATERGRFTVIAEGDERVFGPDGGRDNTALGLIEARFRRELPQFASQEAPNVARPIVTLPSPGPMPRPVPGIPPRPGSPDWSPPTWQGMAGRLSETLGRRAHATITALMATSPMPIAEPAQAPAAPAPLTDYIGDAIERAAGTGLTGSSSQEFVPIHVGTLESEATVIRLRLVIGSEAAIHGARPIPQAESAPARPAARP